ncbi:MAG: lysine biosynthesis protein LysX [Candidatus Caldarchaeum sp.]|uniref:Lysine biosynthesis protein LysX n=1 Tax=Caldiarchaeum subterraneum TaxID=311458 RepID=A0A7C4I5Y1_CALS0|nr:lysine biosynthesis protein LysX [Candidatus Caldarchaeales archaeon]MDJ0272674.1 lysine biosynthesis protein LysX [Candidatus Caldarchaeales archaeon]
MAGKPVIEIAFDTPRLEEKLLAKAVAAKGAELRLTNIKQNVFTLQKTSLDVCLVRCVSLYSAIHTAALREGAGVRSINSSESIFLAGDKVLTVSRLRSANLPIPRTAVGLNTRAAEKALEKVGLPAVDKPPIGSWGRLIALVRDIDDFKLVAEHREMLPSSYMKTHIIQEYIDLPNRDIRTIVIGEEVVGAIYRYRSSNDWRTNVALGGEPVQAFLNDELVEISLRAAKAVKGDVVSIDVFETTDGSYLVNEVNGVPEFKGLMKATGVNVPEKIIDYVIASTRR